MSVRRVRDRWQVRVRHAGGRIERSVAGTKKDAQELETRLRREMLDWKVGRNPNRTIEEALLRWLKSEARVLKSYDDQRSKAALMEPFYAGRKLTEIAEVAQLVKQAGIKAELAAATINRRLAILRRVARLAFRDWQWLDSDLGARIKLIGGEKQRHIYLTTEEVESLAAAAPGRVADAIKLAAMSGLREGELLGLTSAQRVDGRITLTETKNGRPRTVPLPPEAMVIELPLEVSYAQLRRGFEKARTIVGMDHVRFHDLRHTYASWLVQSGASLTVVRDILGHSSLAVTNRYAHLATEHLDAAVNHAFRGTNGVQKTKIAKLKVA